MTVFSNLLPIGERDELVKMVRWWQFLERKFLTTGTYSKINLGFHFCFWKVS